VLPDEGDPAAITVLRGDDQRGRVGEPLNDPLVVQVTDSRGRPVAGATVAFEFSSAGAGAGAVVVPEEKTTDANGEAEARLVLGTAVGRQTGQARVVVSGGSGPIQAPFSAMALSEDANTMAAVAGQDQTGHVGLPLDDRLVVEVTDGFGNPVAGVPISWAAVGGGSVSADVVETDEDGRSRVDRVLGPTVGQQSTVASSEGLAGSPVTFSHTAIAGDASRLVILSGSDQTAEGGTVLPADLVVQLIDGDGNGVPQTAVSWVVATGGGSATPEITTTDGEGRTSTKWTLGGTLGQQRLDAVVSGVGVAAFRATATAGAPAGLFIRTQPPSTARNGVPLARPPAVQLRDGRGNDVATPGVEVTVSLGGGGELGGTIRRATDATGKATFDDLSISGAPGPRTLVFQATGYAQVTSDEIALQAIGTSTTITGDTPDPSGAGITITVSFRVASDGPIPTGTVTVSDGVQSCNGTLSTGAGSCALDLTTVGSRTLTATYGGGPGLNGSSDTEPHTVTPAAPSNQPPTAEFATSCDELECGFEDQSDDPDGRIEERSWTFGDGGTSDERNPGHEYSSSGTYQVSLTVTDNNGATATVTRSVTVSEQAASTSTRFEVDSPDPTTPGQAFTVTLSVRSDDATPVGTATVSDGVNDCVVQIVGGSGSCSLALTTLGPRTLTATFQGNASFATSSANETHTVNPPAVQSLSIREQPSSSVTIGDEFSRQPEIELRLGDGRLERSGVTVTASIASGGGTLGGTPTATTDGDGRAQFENLSISGATGTHTLRFTAGGFGEVISNPIEVGKESSQIQITSFAPNEPIVGQTVRVSFNVTGNGGPPTGNVTVTADGPGETCAGSVSQGFCDIVFTAPGNDRNVTATYGGDGRFDGDTDTEDIDVDPAPPANQPPTAGNDQATTDFDQAVTIDVLNNDDDPEDAALSPTIVSQPTSGSATPNANGTITYAPNSGFSGDDSFSYTVSDGSLTSNVATVAVTVNPAPAPGVLGFRTEPPTTVSSGQLLDPEPEVELLNSNGDPLQVDGVTISAVPVPADAAILGGTTSLQTDGNGRVRFEDLSIEGPSGSTVVIAFTAPGFETVDSQAILIQGD